jgi:hypothetical protein
MHLCQLRKSYTQMFSAPPNCTENRMTSVLKDMIKLTDNTRFVTCRYDTFWWLGCVLSVSEESSDMKISFLYPRGPSASYMYSATPHILWLLLSAILAKVSSKRSTGCTYSLTSEEAKLTGER